MPCTNANTSKSLLTQSEHFTSLHFTTVPFQRPYYAHYREVAQCSTWALYSHPNHLHAVLHCKAQYSSHWKRSTLTLHQSKARTYIDTTAVQFLQQKESNSFKQLYRNGQEDTMLCNRKIQQHVATYANEGDALSVLMMTSTSVTW